MIDFPICQADVPVDNIMYMSGREIVGDPWPPQRRRRVALRAGPTEM